MSMRTAIIIGTYGNPPYVHLQLESCRRLASECPVLVHDDCSPQQHALRELCCRYGVDYCSTPQRLNRVNAAGHLIGFNGDHDCYPAGLRFAETRGADLLVKISRRYLLILPWVEQLELLASESQFATFSGYDERTGYGFVTYLVAFNVRRWLDSGVVTELDEFIREGRDAHPETYIHDLAEKVHNRAVRPATRRWQAAHPPHSGSRGCYGHWPLATVERSFWWPPDRVCHHDQLRAYSTVARSWGLPYDEEAFVLRD